MSTSAAELLSDMGALRRKARRDRSGYWLPLLLFGIFVLAAPLSYRQPKLNSWSYSPFGPTFRIGGLDYSPLLLFNGQALPAANALAVSLYWLGAIVVGTLTTILWYRWRAARVGVQLRVGPYLWWACGALVMALVVVPVLDRLAPLTLSGRWNGSAFWVSVAVFAVGLTLAVLSAGLGVSRNASRSWPRTIGLVAGMALTLIAVGNIGTYASLHGFAVLFVIAAIVVGLAVAERTLLCATIAVFFMAATLIANFYQMANVWYEWFGIGLNGHDFTTVIAFDNLVLPGAVLVIGGLAALITSRSRRHD